MSALGRPQLVNLEIIYKPGAFSNIDCGQVAFFRCATDSPATGKSGHPANFNS